MMVILGQDRMNVPRWINLAWKKYKVRPEQKGSANCNIRFCQYDVAHNDYVYTEDWVDFLIQKLSDDNEYKALKNFKMK